MGRAHMVLRKHLNFCRNLSKSFAQLQSSGFVLEVTWDVF